MDLAWDGSGCRRANRSDLDVAGKAATSTPTWFVSRPEGVWVSTSTTRWT